MDVLIQCSKYMRFIEPFIIEIIKINSRCSSIIALTACGVGRLMECRMKFIDVIFMKHRVNLDPSGKVAVFRARSTNSRQRNKAAALYVNLGARSYRIFGKYNGHAILVFATLMRLLVNREGLLNKLHDYRDCQHERIGRRSLPFQGWCTRAYWPLMRTVNARIKAGTNCHDELSGDIVEKIFSTPINVRTAKRDIYSADNFCRFISFKNSNNNFK